MDIQLIDVSAVIGLCAAVVLTINILLGMMLGTAYKRASLWKKMPERVKKIALDDVHNWTAYVALALVLLHPLFLLLDKSSNFFLADVLFPLHAPKQTLMVSLGTISLYALIIVIITTQKVVKKKMTFRVWKNIHLVSYLTALLFVIHGIFLDPELQDRPVDFLDGEKFVPEVCGIVLIVATVARYRYHRKKRVSVKSPG